MELLSHNKLLSNPTIKGNKMKYVLSSITIILALFIWAISGVITKGQFADQMTIVTNILNAIGFMLVGICIGFSAKRRNRSFTIWAVLGAIMPLFYVLLRHVHYRYPIPEPIDLTVPELEPTIEKTINA